MKKSLLMAMAMVSSALFLAGCSTPQLPPSKISSPSLDENGKYVYQVGSGDVLSVFVWSNPDISGDYPVRPDGKISVSLTDSFVVAGKTTKEIEKSLTSSLSEFIKTPKVTVMVKSAQGNASERVKVIGDAVTPTSLPYSHGLTLFDLMISIGGLSPYADGNDAELHRVVNGEIVVYPIKIEDLMSDVDLSNNVDLNPGDIIMIPEAWF